MARRGHSEGTIQTRKYRKKDGTLVTRFQALLPLDACGRRPSLGCFDTRKEAKNALKDAVVARAQGRLVLEKMPTVREWFTTWLAGRTRIAYRTRVDYEQTFQSVYPYIGHLRLDHLTEQHLGEMWVKLAQGIAADGTRRSPLAATTLTTRHVEVSAALRAAVKSRHVALTYNPAEGAKPEKGERKEINPLMEEEVQKLLAVTTNDPEYPIWVTLIYTGCRRSECLALRWRDVDFERHIISIRGSLHREIGNGHVYGPTKTKKDRVVELRPEIVKALRVHRGHQAEMRLAAGPAWNDLGYVFTRADGQPMDETGLQRKFTRACWKAGIPRRTVKETRHTFATLALLHGVPVKYVSEVLGHSSVQITYDIYSHVIPGMVGEVFSYLDRLVEGF